MLPVRMFGGDFSEHWIDGQRCGPLRRRHSGKGRAVPERCPSISVLLRSTRFTGAISLALGAAERVASRVTGKATGSGVIRHPVRSVSRALHALALSSPARPLANETGNPPGTRWSPRRRTSSCRMLPGNPPCPACHTRVAMDAKKLTPTYARSGAGSGLPGPVAMAWLKCSAQPVQHR
jgi:hypothetical protein